MPDPATQQQTNATQDGAPIAPPPVGEQTNAQGVLPGLVAPFGGGLLGGRPVVAGGFFDAPTLWSGGTADNPCNFPGWGNRYAGSYWTYRFMLQCYKLRLARAAAVSPVIASNWTYEAEEGVPPEALAMVERCFNKLRPAFISDAVRCVDYGWQPFEVVWDVAGGYWTIGRLKPLLVDITTILTDPHGNTTGLRNTGGAPVNAGQQVSAPGDGPRAGDLLASQNKCLVITHDGEAGNHYGRSRLENVRQSAWPDWLSCNQQITALSAKIAGRQAYGIAPPGGYTDPVTGRYREHVEDLADGLTAFAQGKCPAFRSLGLTSAAPEVQAKLADKTLVQFATIDFGSETPAIAGLLERTRHALEGMTEGYLVPSRAISEGQRTGGRSEAETHEDVALTVAQLLGNDIASDVQPLVDAYNYLNFGLPPGSVRVRQSLLNDDSKQTYLAIFQSLNFSQQMQLVAELGIDFDDFFKVLGLKTRKPMNQTADQVLAAAAQQQEEQAKAATAQAKRDQRGPPPGEQTQMSRDAEIALAVAEAEAKPDPATVALGRVAESLASRPQAAPVVNYVPPPMHFAPVTNLSPPPAMTVNVEAAEPATVNVPVSVAAPVVNVPEQPAPVVNVNVEAPPRHTIKTITHAGEGEDRHIVKIDEREVG